MIQILIDQSLKKTVPNLVLGVVLSKVQVTKKSPQLWKEIDKRIKELQSNLTDDSYYLLYWPRALKRSTSTDYKSFM